MGWKGVLRSAIASQRRAVRAQRRAFREAEREAREAQREARDELRQQQAAAAERLVTRYELQLQLLATVHHECGPTIDWRAVASSSKPDAPELPSEAARSAEAALAAFRPGFFSRLFGTAERKRTELQRAVTEASQADNGRRAAYEQACTDWQNARDIAASILRGEASRFRDALEGVDAFDELEEVGATVSIDPASAEVVMVDVVLPSAETVVPQEQFALTQRGKLSTKTMPKTRRHEIYQDYVCGAALRAAREVLAALPVQVACVTVRCPLVDAATGHTANTPVLSVAVPRHKAETLNYEHLDPSEAMANFLHRMGFKKSAGMRPIAALERAELNATV